MEAFNNDQKLKDQLLKELKKHQELDDFIQGEWLSDEKNKNGDFKGCFYGCTMQKKENPREAFSEKYQIDLSFVYITEAIFEGLPKKEARLFPSQSIEKIPLGFDFNKFKSEFFRRNLTKQKEWVTDEKVLIILDECIELFSVPFNKINKEKADSAYSAADSAYSAADSAYSAAYSAYSAAYSAYSAARSAARSAADSAANSAAYSAADSAANYIWMRDLILELLVEKY